jgi:hypothetical protein
MTLTAAEQLRFESCHACQFPLSQGLHTCNIESKDEQIARLEKENAIFRKALDDFNRRGEVLTARQCQGVYAVLIRIASWTPNRFDQHLRHEIGDEDADAILKWLGERNLYT